MYTEYCIYCPIWIIGRFSGNYSETIQEVSYKAVQPVLSLGIS